MGVDIRQYKNNLRRKFRSWREKLTPDRKRSLDGQIFSRIIQMRQFQSAHTVLCFISTRIEVDTHRLIEYCWKHGKRVAVPRCLNDKGRMKFYYINSWRDVEIGKFRLLEPNLSICREVTIFHKSVAIVPGFSFDRSGYRLGFGKGYYDRFLSKYNEIKIGICYNACVTKKLPHGRFDVAVDYLVTEQYRRKIQLYPKLRSANKMEDPYERKNKLGRRSK